MFTSLTDFAVLIVTLSSKRCQSLIRSLEPMVIPPILIASLPTLTIDPLFAKSWYPPRIAQPVPLHQTTPSPQIPGHYALLSALQKN